MTHSANPQSEGLLLLWFLPLLTAAITFVAMKVWKKRESGEYSVPPAYHPPQEVGPAEAGYLVRGGPAGCDVTATLLDLARRDVIAIRPTRSPMARTSGSAPMDYEFHLLQHELRHGDLAPHESTLVFHLFYGGEMTSLAAVRERFAIALPAFRRDVRNQLLDKDLLSYEPVLPREWGGAAVTALGFVVFSGLQTHTLIANTFGWLLIAIAGAGLGAVAFLGLDGDRRTRDGRHVHAKVLGFQEFLRTVNADRLKVLPLETLRENIPYAIALGVASQWTVVFNQIGESGLTQYPELNALLVQAEQLETYVGGLSFETYDALMNAPYGGPDAVRRFIEQGEIARRETTVEDKEHRSLLDLW